MKVAIFFVLGVSGLVGTVLYNGFDGTLWFQAAMFLLAMLLILLLEQAKRGAAGWLICVVDGIVGPDQSFFNHRPAL